ncbi:MAG: large subunit ribosomal protein L13 [Sphingobacteriales bacterium]
MNTLSYKTVSANKNTVNKEWVIVDASSQVLGRFSSEVAMLLRGKRKPNYTPHVDCGDNVIVINAEKIRLTGNKAQQKEYVHHTGHPGGQRVRSFSRVMEAKPTEAVEKAIRGMLPKNILGRELFRNLYVYAGEKHSHEAQQPKKLEF